MDAALVLDAALQISLSRRNCASSTERCCHVQSTRLPNGVDPRAPGETERYVVADRSLWSYAIDDAHPTRESAVRSQRICFIVIVSAQLTAGTRAPGRKPRARRRGLGRVGRARLLDDLVRPQQQGLRDREPERLRRLQVDDQLKSRRLLDREVGELGPSQEFVPRLRGERRRPAYHGGRRSSG